MQHYLHFLCKGIAISPLNDCYQSASVPSMRSCSVRSRVEDKLQISWMRVARDCRRISSCIHRRVHFASLLLKICHTLFKLFILFGLLLCRSRSCVPSIAMPLFLVVGTVLLQRILWIRSDTESMTNAAKNEVFVLVHQGSGIQDGGTVAVALVHLLLLFSFSDKVHCTAWPFICAKH